MQAQQEKRRVWLENDQVKLGVDLTMGGSITYLSAGNDRPNMINSFDLGRQIQMSFYSGPVPYHPPGVEFSPRWKDMAWNPVQSGDAYGNHSRILEHREDETSIYVKSAPMLWPLRNDPAECTFETWYTLRQNTVEVVARINNARSDHKQYPAQQQELPAIYTNGIWYKLTTYIGDKPFTEAPLTTITHRDPAFNRRPRRIHATENWAALLNEGNSGVGVVAPGTTEFIGAYFGEKGAYGGSKDEETGYMAPVRNEILDHNIVYEYRYTLVVGTLQQIRDYAYKKHAADQETPNWQFTTDRAHWCYNNATDTGWPIQGELRLNWTGDAASLVSPTTLWTAVQAPTLYMEAAFDTPAKEMRVQWEAFTDAHLDSGPDHPAPQKPVAVAINGDGQYRIYRVQLAGAPNYSGSLMKLHLLLPAGGGEARIRSIGFIAPVER